MKPTRIHSLFLVALLLLPIFTLAETATQENIIITDMLGREVAFDQPVKSLVVLQASDAEILYTIGAGDRIIGRGEYVNYPAEVMALPSVQSGFETNYEQILALEPEAVIMTKMSQAEKDAMKLEEAGIKVVVTDAQNIEGVYAAITLLGQLTGKNEEADALAASMRASFADLTEKTAGTQGGTVYFEVSPLEFGLWTAGKSTFMDEIAVILGLQNAFYDIEGWQAVSEEQVLTRDPDYIVTTAMYFGEGLEPVEEIMARPNWENLKAVKGKAVFNSDSDAITRPGPRLVDAAKALYDFVYGQAE